MRTKFAVISNWYFVIWEKEETICPQEALASSKALSEIVNSDQGSHFTSPKFIGILKAKQIRISMDGRVRRMDNIFTEKLWRTVKQENIYLNSYQNVACARTGLNEYFSSMTICVAINFLITKLRRKCIFKIYKKILTNSYHLIPRNSVS